MARARYTLPGPAPTPAVPAREKVRRFLLDRWAGRILLGALCVVLAPLSGVPMPEPLDGLAWAVLWIFGLWAAFRASSFALRKLLWRIRTKLIVSYLFIAVVPICLLALFFFIAGALFSGIVASHLVEAEVARKATLLEGVARTTLPHLDPARPPTAEGLRARLAVARQVHPKASWALVRKGQPVLSEGKAPTELPPWWKGPGFSGLVGSGQGDLVRAIWGDPLAFLVIDVPVDADFFAELQEATGLRVLTTGGTVESNDGSGSIRVRTEDVTQISDPKQGGSMMFVAPVSRTAWDTGASSPDPITFQYSPLDLIKKLSPRTHNIGTKLVQALVIVGVVFLVMYGVALSIGWLLARSITKGVHELSKGTTRLRQGEFDEPVRVQSKDQLGELADSFNMMSAGIRDLLHSQVEKERLEEELRIARQIQMSLLPQGAVDLPGVRIAALCLPATEVGGDYYDLLPLSQARMGVLVADVSGKGTSAALYMAELKGLVLSLSRIYASPRKLLSEANRILASTLDPRSFITMTYAVVDTAARTMRLARAGHNPVIVFEKATGLTRVIAPPGMGLGLDKGDTFDRVLEEVELTLRPGDLFLFFTDGLSEAMNSASELFGETRLREILAQAEHLSSEEIKERILAEIRKFVAGAAQHDDMTLVILKVVVE